VGGRGVLEQVLLYGVAVEPGDGAQPAGDRRPCPARGLQVPAEALDVGPSGSEQVQSPPPAPDAVHPQVEGVGIAGQAGVAGQKPCQRGLLVLAKQGLIHRCKHGAGDGSGGGHDDLPKIRPEPDPGPSPRQPMHTEATTATRAPSSVDYVPDHVGGVDPVLGRRYARCRRATPYADMHGQVADGCAIPVLHAYTGRCMAMRIDRPRIAARSETGHGVG
jgi:hypothetical protein